MDRFDEHTTSARVREGQRFTVVLEAVGTAGYQWSLAGHQGGVRTVEQDASANSTRVGGPSVHTFTFVAERKGPAKLNFALGRPWEQKPERTHTLAVTIV